MGNYTIVDLDKIVKKLGYYAVADDVDHYTSSCDVCGAVVQQCHNECPECFLPVVWLNSSVWKNLYGNAKAREKELRLVPATTEAGKFLCAQTGIRAFANESEAKAWERCERFFGADEMKKVVVYVTADKRGRAAFAHAMATARKKWRERPTKKPHQQENQAFTSSW